jgi:hypothetical protein
LSSIKSDQVEEEVIIEEVKEVIKDEKTLFYESLTSKVLPEKEKKLKEKQNKVKIDLKSIKKSDKNNEGSEKENTENNCKTIVDKD